MITSLKFNNCFAFNNTSRNEFESRYENKEIFI